MKFRCDGLELSEAISVVSKAISSKTTSQILEGIKMVCAEDKLILSATDLEMSVEKTIRAEVYNAGETVVPGRLFGEYIKKLTNEQIECELNEKNQLRIAYTDSEGTIKVFVHSNNIMVDLGDTIVINRLIDGQFINYKQIVPKDFSTVVTINKEQLEDAIDRASVLSRIDKNNLVKFDIKEKNLMLTSTSEIGNTKENITVGVKGEDLNISFNSKYFSDCLRVIDNSYVKMNLNSAIQPCVITPCEGEDFVFLILPVKAR